MFSPVFGPILSGLKQTMRIAVFQLQINFSKYELYETGVSNFHSQRTYH